MTLDQELDDPFFQKAYSRGKNAAKALTVAAGLYGTAACGGGDGGGNGGPPTGPDPNEAPSANVTTTQTEGLAPLETTVELTCSDSDGTVEEYRLDLNGDEAFEVTRSSAIDTTVAFEQDITVRGQCVDDDGAESPVAEVTLDVIQPATLTVHLRNLTQDGEPFVRGEGEITYVVGTDTVTSPDSVVVENVDPRGPEVWATHASFYDPWGLVKDDGQGKFEHRAHRGVEKASSTIDVAEGESLRLFVYKIRRANVEGETCNENGETRPCTIEDVATVIDNEHEAGGPLEGTDRYTTREIPIWINETESDSVPQSGVDAIKHWATTDNKREGAKGLTDGFVQDMPLQVGGEEPTGPHYQVIFVDRNTQGENVEDNEIQRSVVRLDADRPGGYEKNQQILVIEMTQGLGLRDDIGSSLSDECLNITDFSLFTAEYSNFCLGVGKILYWFPPGTHFHQP